MTNEYIEVSKLVKSPLNVRKTVSKAADKELKASILAHGLMQNLVVTDAGDGTYPVIGGARRLAALQELIEKKKLPADHAVPCQIVTEERAAEMSLAENTVRQAMHPMDEFEAFSALAEQGEKPEAIAKRFGATRKHVEQRLRLGRVAPEIRQAYRDDKLRLDALMAYALTDDQAKQMRVFESQKNGQHEYSIRRALTESMIGADDKLAKFVGLDAYKAAGGTVKEDLFRDDVFLEDAELVSRLATEKLEVEADKLRHAGWGWVEVAQEREYRFTGQCGRIHQMSRDVPQELTAELETAEAEQTRIAKLLDETDFSQEPAGSMERLEAEEKAVEARLSEIEQKLGSFVGFDPGQMTSAGCYVTISYGGKLEIDWGLVRPEDRKAIAKSKSESGDREDAAEPEAKLSESLKRDLGVYRLAVAQAEIASHPAIAFDLLVFKVAKNALALWSAHDGPEVSFSRNYGGSASADACKFVASQMQEVAQSLPMKWLEPEAEADQFLAFQGLPQPQKHALLAYCVGLTLRPKLGAGEPLTAYDVALAQTGANVAEDWRPTKDNYLGRITKDQLLDLGAEIFGPEWASSRRNSKKSELAEGLHQNFGNPGVYGKTPEQVERLENWLPEGIAFPTIEPEAEAKPAKKGQKAA